MFHGDNLKFLQGINTGSIPLIYADPPFNKNRDFHSDPESLAAGSGFEDRWRWDDDVHDDWVESIRNDWPGVHSVIEAAKLASGVDMAAFLCWLGVRLIECHRILRDDGTLYLHIDHTAHAWVKCMMDDIFGRQNFLNEVVWHYGKMSNTSRSFPRNHDTILRYSKTADYYFRPIKGAESEYKVRYSNFLTGNQVLWGSVKHKRDKLVTGRATKVERELGRKLRDEDVLFDFDIEWKKQSDVIYVPIIKGNAKEQTGFETQKPLRLLRKIVSASSRKGDMVLDPFCGCATTPIAAEQLGRCWAGIDIWEKAHDMVLSRLQSEGLAVPDREYDGQANLIPFGKVMYTRTVPVRTDDMKVAVADFELERQVPLEPWEKLKTKQMREILEKTQASTAGMVVCAGCGRHLEPEFMELDHNHPKSLGGENVITNRILLCRPCNGFKGNKETVAGLWTSNNQSRWMQDETLAKIVYDKAVTETRNVKRRLRGTR